MKDWLKGLDPVTKWRMARKVMTENRSSRLRDMVMAARNDMASEACQAVEVGRSK